MQLKIKSNVNQVAKWLTESQKKHVPKATAKALTFTAQDAQTAIQDAIPSRFRVTKKWWLKQQPTGIKIKSATPGNLTAVVYTLAYFAALQEYGGIKTPHESRTLAIPSDKVPKSRRKSGGAAIMMKQKKTFANKRGIYRKKGGKKSRTIERLFTFKRSAHIRARFGFERTARQVAVAKFDRIFLRVLGKSIGK